MQTMLKSMCKCNYTLQRSKSNCKDYYDLDQLKLERNRIAKETKKIKNVEYLTNKRNKQTEMDHEETRRKDAERKKLQRDQQIKTNPEETRRKVAEKVKIHTNKKI